VTADTWCVVVVRAWVDEERLTVRLLSSGAGGDRAVVVTSIDAAGRQLADLLSILVGDRPDDDGDDRGGTRS
jgi:hypothetical protein